MKVAKKRGLKNIWVSNGYMTNEALDLILPYLDAVNIDLKAWNNDTYIKYCGSKVQPILDNIRYLRENGVHVEVTTLVVPGVNDDIEQLENIAGFIAGVDKNIPWHLSRFFPAWKMNDTPVTPVSTLEMAEDIGRKAGLKYIHLGNI